MSVYKRRTWVERIDEHRVHQVVGFFAAKERKSSISFCRLGLVNMKVRPGFILLY